jgi:phosphoglycolate phosphatase-like HAD superfamily hydrolase
MPPQGGQVLLASADEQQRQHGSPMSLLQSIAGHQTLFHLAPDAHLVMDRMRKRSEEARQRAQAAVIDSRVASPAAMCVITDFDLTLTAPGSVQCHDMMVASSHVPEQCRAALRPFLCGEVAVESHEDWWQRVHTILDHHNAAEFDVKAIVAEQIDSGNLNLRPGAENFLRSCSKLSIPVLVASAGITELVEATLQHHDLLFPNIKICANSLSSWKTLGLRHGANKHELKDRQKDYFEMLRRSNRSCAIVCGDKPADGRAAEGIGFDEVLRIGFYDKGHHTCSAYNLEDYCEAYDVCARGSHSLELVTAAISWIIS